MPRTSASWVAWALVGSMLVGTLAAADGPPWRERSRRGVSPNRVAAERVRPADWPPEPRSPRAVDPVPFAEALETLCGWMPPGRALRYTRSVLNHADEFEVDPFLLGALIHRMGRCRADADALSGYGLTLLVPRMYYGHLKRGRYRYWVREAERWVERHLALDRFPFGGARLKRADENLYFAAGLLRAWREQHESLDEAFEQAPHRQYVSHFVWGDRVPSDRAEDRILLDRRKLLLYYGAIDRHPPFERLGLEMGSPLDAAPRVISSFLGAGRDGGERRHRGIDVESDFREPVRAIARGTVNFAGVDLPGSQRHANLSPGEIAAVPRKQLAAGGRFVCIMHEPEGGEHEWVRSCYMHLEDVLVRYGDEVERGQRIGTVGRTGMRVSAPHLHLEIHVPDGLLDASEVLQGPLLGRRVELE